MSPSDRYVSTVWFDSETRAGVRFGIVRVSFGRRIELARRIREIGRKAEYLEASSDAAREVGSDGAGGGDRSGVSGMGIDRRGGIGDRRGRSDAEDAD